MVVVGRNQPNKLRVEGPDDLYTIRELLFLHGIDYKTTQLPREVPEISASGGVTEMLRGMGDQVRATVDQVVGFVLDADSPLDSRWEAVRGQLDRARVQTPERPPPEGFIAQLRAPKGKLGVWLMPDNQQDGKLETLLQTLVREEDTLIGHAEHSTEAAKRLGAKFTDPDQAKAVLHAWLAWQEEPGLPYGTAIRAKYFRHDSPAALAFVAWFRKLYGIA
jgi:hypothetical protein